MNASQNRLMSLSKDLHAEWMATKEHWSDAKSLEFEKRFLDELNANVNQAISSIDALERVLNKVRDDCE